METQERKQGGRRAERARRSWRFYGFLLCLAVFLASGGLWLRDQVRAAREQAAYDALARQVRQAEEQLSQAPPAQQTQPEEAGPLPQYLELYEANPDFAGWLRLEGTKLDYPVMYTPDRPWYYLRRAFDGSYSVSGTPFLEEDGFPGCGNAIIYGHHMNNGTMFGAVSSYAKEDFWREHPEIRFDTRFEEGVYQVMAAFYVDVLPDTAEPFPYYEYSDLREPERFQEYVELVEEAALYDTGVTARYGDELLTLSTCSYHTEDGRFVVVARRAGEGAEAPSPQGGGE